MNSSGLFVCRQPWLIVTLGFESCVCDFEQHKTTRRQYKHVHIIPHHHIHLSTRDVRTLDTNVLGLAQVADRSAAMTQATAPATPGVAMEVPVG